METEKENAIKASAAKFISDMNHVFGAYHAQIERVIKENTSSLGRKSKLRDACEYALLNGGKRFRPALVLMIAKALGSRTDATQAALAIEYFHTASLIADDLPCMDDDDFRREKPSTHKVFGESIALLASYALISAGYECLAKNSKTSPSNGDLICRLALENATYNTGLLGATGGQFLDLFPPDLSLETLRDIIHKKTVSLFEISFVFGWLFGGGNLDQINDVKKAASHFGMAFQIADDLGDVAQDIKNQRKVNFALVFGPENALDMFRSEIDAFAKMIVSLKINTQEFQAIIALLTKQAEAAV